MNNLPTIKVYQIDYEFIIKNYLDKSLWKRIWNLLVFKDNIFTLNLSRINTKEEKIYFDVNFNKLNNQWKYNQTEEVIYDINNMTIKLLKKQIGGAIFRLAEKLDKLDIEESMEYKELDDNSNQEEDYLREIASDFLDKEGVTNSDIRETYIDVYIDNNRTIYSKLDELINYLKYNYETELLLMICEIIHDDNRKQDIIENLNNRDGLEKLQNEVKEYMNYVETEDWTDEVRDNLVAI